jgi:hypothetical protein
MKMRKLLAPALGLALVLPGISVQAEEAPTVNTPAADLRANLDHLLSEHYTLAVESMMKTYDGAKDARQAQAALEQNGEDMTPAIASIYGEKAAQQFEDIFTSHNKYTDDLAKAVKDGDEMAEAAAEQKVDDFAKEFGSFLAAATEGNLPEKAAIDAVQAHEDYVQDTFDAYVAEDYKAAYADYLEGFDNIFDISKALSGAITTQNPEKFDNTTVDTQAAELRSSLNKLAAEHFALAEMSMAKGAMGAKDYDFITWAEDQNTAEFKAAIASVYGEKGADQFEQIWTTDHINAQGDLASAVANNDQEAITAAKERLNNDFAVKFGDFLGTATEGNLPADAAKDAIMQHENSVIMTFEQHIAGDYEQSYQTYREGYALMFTIGQTLSDAIVKQNPEMFAMQNMPEAMPNTGLGSGEDHTGSIMWVSAAGLFIVGMGFFIQRKASKLK